MSLFLLSDAYIPSGQYPHAFLPVNVDAAIAVALEGKGVNEIAAAAGVSLPTLWRVMEKDASFREQVMRARDCGIDVLVDETIAIARDPSIAVDRARALGDAIRWLAARRKRAIYGDKVDMTINGQIDLSGTLIEARKRLICDPLMAIESQDAEYAVLLPPSAADTQSADEPSIFD